MPFTITCDACGEDVLVSDVVADGDERALRQHLAVLHPKLSRPDTLTELLRYFVVTATA